MTKNHLDISTLESWLWEAACVIHGPVDAPKYKDYILPLIFLKRLSDVFADEIQMLGEEIGDERVAWDLVEADHKLVRFYIAPEARWSHIASLPQSGLGEALTDAVRSISRENPRLAGVIDITDFNATTAGQRIISDANLHRLVQVLNKYRVGLDNVEPDFLGRAYEYLIRKFAEGGGQSAGEFYTPRMVGVLMAKILAPEPGMTVYDPTCGSGGLLIKCQLELLEQYGAQKNSHKELPSTTAPLKIYGQEILATSYAMANMNAFIHDMDSKIALGDTMNTPKFTQPDGSLQQFDIVTANPMWNQKTFTQEFYTNDPFERFSKGIPPNSSADWGWVQHMMASLGPNGCMAVVLDTGSVSRGSGNQGSNRERDIRKVYVEDDKVEAVFLLPENLFYNTTAPGIIMVFNKAKHHPGEILLVNASQLFVKGRPKNELTDEHVEQISKLYHEWKEEDKVSKIIKIEEAAKNDYNLSPSRYVSTNDEEPVLPLEEAVVLLEEAEEEREVADKALKEVLAKLGLVKEWTTIVK